MKPLGNKAGGEWMKMSELAKATVAGHLYCYALLSRGGQDVHIAIHLLLFGRYIDMCADTMTSKLKQWTLARVSRRSRDDCFVCLVTSLIRIVCYLVFYLLIRVVSINTCSIESIYIYIDYI